MRMWREATSPPTTRGATGRSRRKRWVHGSRADTPRCRTTAPSFRSEVLRIRVPLTDRALLGFFGTARDPLFTSSSSELVVRRHAHVAGGDFTTYDARRDWSFTTQAMGSWITGGYPEVQDDGTILPIGSAAHPRPPDRPRAVGLLRDRSRPAVHQLVFGTGGEAACACGGRRLHHLRRAARLVVHDASDGFMDHGRIPRGAGRRHHPSDRKCCASASP